MHHPTFYVGLHQPNHAANFPHCMISLNRLIVRSHDGTYAHRRDGALRIRQKPIAGRVFLDSGAFTVLERYGHYPETAQEFCAAVRHLATICTLVAVSSQDYMCEPKMLAITGLTVRQHQRLTIERYDQIRAGLPASIPVVPVIQGYQPHEYVRHIADYGPRLEPGMWVGIGSVCKRNGKLRELEAVLIAIHDTRPDLRYHGYGLKTTALRSSIVRSILHSTDSLAWSYAARRRGGNPNDWHEAAAFAERLQAQPATRRTYQYSLPL